MTSDDGDVAAEPFDHLGLVEPYLPVSSGIPEVIEFEYRFATLVWLYRTVMTAIDAEDLRLREIMRQGTHRVSGWEGESDLMLNESILILEYDAAPIHAGSILAASCSALESLLTVLLPGRPLRGLMAKARALATLWPNRDEADEILANAEWLAARRNSFAHRLTDEGGHRDGNSNARGYVFDDETVEETFCRCGEIATLINHRYDDFVRSRDT
ncbi:hypothetical protein [Nocardia brasiliensis]|uniref:hypothetical protein n=1 Tax=Nocardia brasiliensis TaxID=37326 RepID=UPI0024568928|nr:hypothetical protein [Nocardia brasiliensis]